MDWQEGTTIAQRLCVRGSGLDALTARLRLTSLLDAVDLRPPGLPPSAVVCIRRLRDPLPGALSLQRSGQRPPHAWEHALTHALAQSVQQAARPIEGPVPANAEAVVFNDRAELLACLAHDWCEGAIHMHWWWQSLLRGKFDRSVLAAWLAAPEYAPAALQHLVQRGTLLPFASKLSSAEARQLLESITCSFALYELQPLLSSLSDTLDEGVESRREEQGIESGKRAGELSPARRDEGGRRREDADTYTRKGSASYVPPAPWSRWIPESTAIGPSLQHQSLVGVGLMLWRAPMHLRSAAFLRSMRHWLIEISVAGKDNEMLSGVVSRLNMDISQRNDHADNDASYLQEEPRPGDDEGFQHVAPWEDSDNHRGYLSLPDASTSSLPLNDGAAAVENGETVGEGDAASVPVRFNMFLVEKEGEHQAVVPSESPERPAPELQEAEEVDTAYGGLFYLLNLALALNLYRDFTSPLLPGIPLSIWDFLALVGEWLIGEALRTDPIWGLLARLAGRDEHEAPGQDFVPVTGWCVPVAWLAAFPEEDAWEWCVVPAPLTYQQDGRLCVFHPAGFAVLDVPLTGNDALQQLMQAMQHYGDVRLVQRSREECQAPGASSPLVRWLGWLVPYMCSRLQRALRLAEGSVMARTLCEHPAHIVATATHLDIFLSLNDLPIEIRLAGLDRDPAWIPAAGRFVAFHFV